MLVHPTTVMAEHRYRGEQLGQHFPTKESPSGGLHHAKRRGFAPGPEIFEALLVKVRRGARRRARAFSTSISKST